MGKKSEDYIPDGDLEYLAWLDNFSSFCQTTGLALGLTGQQAIDMVSEKLGYEARLSAQQQAQLAAKAATQEKKGSKASSKAMARQLAQFMTNNPAMTDAQREEAGLTVPDKKPTPADPGKIGATDPPLLKLDWSERRRVVIHWGPNPEDERNNGKPAGVAGAKIWFALGGIPSDDASWAELDEDTASPFEHMLAITVPTTIAYRAQYFDSKMRKGTFGDPVVCTVTP